MITIKVTSTKLLIFMVLNLLCLFVYFYTFSPNLKVRLHSDQRKEKVTLSHDRPKSDLQFEPDIDFDLKEEKKPLISKSKESPSLDLPTKQVLDDKTRVLAAAKRITKANDTLLVSFINDAYLPFAYSWLCNTEGMNVHHKVLIIAADRKTEEHLKKKRPEIATVSISGYKMAGNQRYTRAGYVRIGIKRTQVLNWILQENIGIFLFEFDCLWVRNPVPEMTKFVEHDLVITPVAQRPGMVAIGFYYMAPTTRMKKLWLELTKRLTVLDQRLQKLAPGTVISEGDNDQLYLTALIKKKYADVRVKLLSLSQYPDGKWYEMKKDNRPDISKIFILNNNWIEGNSNKIRRAKEWGHWFVKKDGTCDDEQVNQVVQLY